MTRSEHPRKGESGPLVSSLQGAAEALRASEERLRLASLAANLGLWSYDLGTRKLSLDQNAGLLLGVDERSFGRRLDSYLARESGTGQDQFFLEFHADSAHGRRRGLQARGTVVRDGDGAPSRVHGAVWDATDLRGAEQASRESERSFRTVLENALSGMALADDQGRLKQVNHALCQLLGYTESELLQRTLFDLLHSGDVPPSREGIARMVHAESDSHRDELRLYRADGDLVWVALSVAIARGDAGDPVQLVLQVEDITERRRSERAYAQAEQRFRSAFDEARVGMAIVDVEVEGRVTLGRVNSTLCALTGKTKQELEGTGIETLIRPEDLERVHASFAELAHGGTAFAYEAQVHGPNGAIPAALNASVMLAADRFRQVLLNVNDITDRKQVEGWLEHLADHDPLTGLLNRRRFGEVLTKEVAGAQRYGRGGAVLALDLDGFKYVNDSLGHAVGDELIVKVAHLLRGRLRDSDTLARIGGDEFAVVLPRANAQQAREVAQQLIDAISQAVVSSAGGLRRITASVGVSMFHDNPGARSSEGLLKEADIALYDAKEAGRNQVALFNPASQRQSEMTERLRWAERVRDALAEGRFVLHAQPILSLDGDPRTRHELLIRMVSPEGDLIHPRSFLDTAERFELIQDIDRWVVRTAIRMLAERQRRGEDLCFEINLSAKSIGDQYLPALIESELRRTGTDPRSLVFEITETAAIVNLQQAKAFAERLAVLGCEFALDDFGSGFASFYYLKHLAFDYVKIDGEFIRDLPGSHTSRLVVQAVAEVARGLGKKTIAEFVQDEDTLRLLREYGVDYAQGFHIGRPGPMPDGEPG